MNKTQQQFLFKYLIPVIVSTFAIFIVVAVAIKIKYFNSLDTRNNTIYTCITHNQISPCEQQKDITK
jgi:hypothetical protein